jgi:hypothetical protein
MRKVLNLCLVDTEATMPVWGSVKSPGGLLSIMRTLKKVMWMTRLSSHFLCLCSMHCSFPPAATKWLGCTI